ncbi:MAG: ATP-binding protein [Parvularculaceae bacterium]
MDVCKALVIEDDDLDFEILSRYLARSQAPRFELVRTESVADARQAIQDDRFDVGLFDQRLLDGSSGIDFVEELGGRNADFPIILITGMDGEVLDRKAMHAGAYDYVDKSSFSYEVMDRSIRFAIESHSREQRLRAATAAAKEQTAIAQGILAVVGHEMKSPVSSIKGYSKFINENALESPVRDAAGRMHVAAAHLEDFLQNLSEFVKLDNDAAALSRDRFNVREMIDGTISLFAPYANHKSIALNVEAAEELDADYVGDKLRLRQVIINLVKNAINYSDGGVITIAASVANNRFRFSVADQGVGMSEDKIEVALSNEIRPLGSSGSFTGGLGIGLSICRRLIRLMNGTFKLESAEGLGTTASFETPIERADASLSAA